VGLKLLKGRYEEMAGYATISDVSRRWGVDRATARSAIAAAGIPPSADHVSARYFWPDILRTIEGWPAEVIAKIDV
jgi:hypothetical protein